MLTSERNRYLLARAAVRPSIQQIVRALERARAATNDDMDQWIQASPVWRAQEDLLRCMRGIGPQTTRLVLAMLP